MAQQLTPAQQTALADLRIILESSNTTPPDDILLVSLLQVEQWDVQSAARTIQDNSAAEQRRSGADDETIARSFASGSVQTFQIDDSQISLGTSNGALSNRFAAGAGLGDENRYNRLQPNRNSVSSILWSTLTFPFSLAQSLLVFLARLFRIRSIFSMLFGLGGDSIAKGVGSTDPRLSAERYIRELEQDTGAHVQVPGRSASAHASSIDSSTSRDSPTGPPPAKNLPPFFVGGYSDALKLIKQDIKILAVILTSREHGDVDYFRKNTLVDQDLVQHLSSPEFIVWGGDVHEREAYQVATMLEATTYPFVAFIALQPTRAGRRAGLNHASSVSSPRPAVLSRLEGSPLTATSASAIVLHITDVVLPRTRNFLGRLRSEKLQREMERQLKAEQDRAYMEASRKDAERIGKKREEEKKRADEQERQNREQEMKKREQEKKAIWRHWASHHLVPVEPAADERAIKLGFRLPNGQTLSRRFQESDSLESVFAYVETATTQGDQAAQAVPRHPPIDYQHSFRFSLVSGYPRRRLEVSNFTREDGSATVLGDIDGLAPSANLIVEGKIDSGAGLEQGSESEADSDDDED